MSARPTRSSGQLALELPLALPAIAVAPEWKDQQRLWGHAFHPMCSYLASFPAALAHAFIARYSRPGDVVLDPFSGRGTTPLQACAEGRIGVGNDLNPFAHLLTAAKVEPPTRAQAATRLATLRLGWRATSRAGWTSARACPPIRRAAHPSSRRPDPGSGRTRAARRVPVEVALAFHPRTLGQLLYVRTRLRLDDRTDRFLAAAITGHPPRQERLVPVGADAEHVLDGAALRPRLRRAHRVHLAGPGRVRRAVEEARPAVSRHPAVDGGGRAARRCPGRRRARARRRCAPAGDPDRARLVVTSPPYLRVVKYGYYNWLRTWFLGFDAREIDATLDDAHHREPYLAFLRDVLAGLRPILTDDAVVVLVIGDVETDRGRSIKGGVGLAERAWESAAEPEGYRLAGVALDDVAASGR